MTDFTSFIPWAALFLGLAARVFIPFLVERKNNPEMPWEWRFVWPQLVSFGLIVLVLPLVLDAVEEVAEMSWQVAWLAGWAAADVGRQIIKAFEGGEAPE